MSVYAGHFARFSVWRGLLIHWWLVRLQHGPPNSTSNLRSPLPRRADGRRVRRRALEREQIAGLALEHLAELLECAEPNGLRPAGLQHRKILRGDADAVGELVQSHLAAREHHIHVHYDRHVDTQIVSSASRCSASA